jgi:CheY-like chemotaxis protein
MSDHQVHRRVLIVDDDRDQATTLRLLLEIAGYEVQAAFDGPSGVRLAAEWLPQTVLCDLGLPGLDGYGVAAELRRNPATAHAHLVAVSGYGTDQDCERSKAAGFDQHLLKPTDPSTLLQLVAGDGTPH